MSFRLLTHRLFKNGRFLLKYYCKRDINTNIFENGVNKRKIPTTGSGNGAGGGNRKPNQINLSQQAWKQSSLLRFGQHARRLFVDNILHRVTTTQSAQLRAEVTKK